MTDVNAWHYARHAVFGLRRNIFDAKKGYAVERWGCLDADCRLNATAPEWVKDMLRRPTMTDVNAEQVCECSHSWNHHKYNGHADYYCDFKSGHLYCACGAYSWPGTESAPPASDLDDVSINSHGSHSTPASAGEAKRELCPVCLGKGDIVGSTLPWGCPNPDCWGSGYVPSKPKTTTEPRPTGGTDELALNDPNSTTEPGEKYNSETANYTLEPNSKIAEPVVGEDEVGQILKRHTYDEASLCRDCWCVTGTIYSENDDDGRCGKCGAFKTKKAATDHRHNGGGRR